MGVGTIVERSRVGGGGGGVDLSSFLKLHENPSRGTGSGGKLDTSMVSARKQTSSLTLVSLARLLLDRSY